MNEPKNLERKNIRKKKSKDLEFQECEDDHVEEYIPDDKRHNKKVKEKPPLEMIEEKRQYAVAHSQGLKTTIILKNLEKAGENSYIFQHIAITNI